MEIGQTERILALDVGKRRIGLAISDPLGITAQGLPTLERTTIREDVAKLVDLASERSVSLFVIGKPLHMSGDESRQAEYIKNFGGRLTKKPVFQFNSGTSGSPRSKRRGF